MGSSDRHNGVLRVQHLEVRYGDLVGVADVSLEVPPGSVVALLGSNGAGKTTTLNAIVGLVHATAGTIEWDEERIENLNAYAIVTKGLALSPEGWRLFVGQTVEQNLRLGATALSDRQRISFLLDRVYTLFPVLAARRKQRAGTLSGGERQMLALSRALMSEPRQLLLDEPSLGLAPMVVEALYDTLDRLHRVGTGVRRLRLCPADRAHRIRGSGLPTRDRSPGPESLPRYCRRNGREERRLIAGCGASARKG
jgi:branched-chain amino acid transport system ATP-binding protein